MFPCAERQLIHFLFLGSLVMTLSSGVKVSADDTELKALKERIERLEKQNEELRTMLGLSVATESDKKKADPNLPPLPKIEVEKIVGDYLKQRDAKAKQEEEEKRKKAEEEGYKVGTDLKGSIRWGEDVNGLKFETTNKDFWVHVGGWSQFDGVWWDQSPITRKPSQLGDFQDGAFFRRTRLQIEGQAWEVIEWNFIPALEGVSSGVVGLDEMWAGITKIPILGTIRAGRIKVPQGLEGDQVSSSRAMTFLERSTITDAFFFNFGQGIWTGNSVLDQHLTWSGMFYRVERDASGADFGDGEYAASGRLTFLPIYENEGRCLVHLGASTTWRNGKREHNANGIFTDRLVRFRARPEQRDAIGTFGLASVTGNDARLVDTGLLPASDVWVNAAELLAIYGPLSLQAEWAFCNVQDALVNQQRGGLGFNGGYLQLSYFLTGEHRYYDRRLGRLATFYTRPFTNFWSVRNEDGSLNFGLGAWEIAARYSYLNLNDGPLQGGVMQGITLGLNWYFNPNFKIQFEYIDDARWHKNTPPFGTASGWVDGFGIRMQLMF